jgi:acyl dehydratase
MTTVLRGKEDLRRHVGEHLGHSRYIAISQEEVNRFADLSGDHQWIHVDEERARAGPFGGTIVHGNLTLSKGGLQVAFRLTVEPEGGRKPVCVADLLVRYAV